MQTPCLLVAALAALVPFVNGQAAYEKGDNCFDTQWDVSQNLKREDYQRVIDELGDADEKPQKLEMDNHLEWSLSDWMKTTMPKVRATWFGTKVKPVPYLDVADAVLKIQRRCGEKGGRQNIYMFGENDKENVIAIKITRN